MASTILIKRSTTAGSVPTTADLSQGELAVNVADKKLYTNNGTAIIEIGTVASTLDVEGALGVDGDLDVNTNKFTVASATGNTTVAGTLAVQGDADFNGNFDIAGQLILQTEGTASNHVVTKAYVDQAVTDLIGTAGTALDTLGELADAINDDASFAATVTTALGTKLNLSGGTMTGNIVMGANKVTSTATPTSADDLTRKGYIDGLYGDTASAAASAAAAASSASDALTSEGNAATSASNASTSATNAAASATAASTSESNAADSETAASGYAASASNSASAAATSATQAATSAANAESAYDSFDDRYLGAKASDPTLDNDGDALIEGAMYFDSSNDVMKVYNGTEWQNASSSIEGIKADFQYTATSGQTSFSGADDNTNTLVIDKAELTNVYLNGVRLATTDYTVTPASNLVTLNVGASTGDIVEIEVFGNFAGQSGADVAITGGSITGVTLNATSFTSTGIDDNATSTAITIDSNENVGIGTTSPSSRLNVLDSAGGNIAFFTNGADADLAVNCTSGVTRISPTTGVLSLGTSSTERARIDSNGNLLVGTTDTSLYNNGAGASTGVLLRGSVGNIQAARSGGAPLDLNRLGNDGEIAAFHKDGATVGSIGTYLGDLTVGNEDTGLLYHNADNAIKPWHVTANVARNGVTDLGDASHRFKDLYLSGGVYLGGTGSANKLDDYEEGTWTPDLTRSDLTSVASSYTYRSGTYTKIGNLVYIRFGLYVSGIQNQNGTELKLTGLPFIVNGHGGYQEPTASLQGGGFATTSALAGTIYAFGRNGTTQLGIRAGYTNADTVVSCNEIQAGTYISVTMQYETNS
jgi:hypothetical protein